MKPAKYLIAFSVFGMIIGVTTPVNAISLGFKENTFTQLDGDNIEDRELSPNSSFTADVVLDTDGLNNRKIKRLQYTVFINDNNELEFGGGNLDLPGIFDNSNSNLASATQLEVEHSDNNGVSEGAADGGVTLDTGSFVAGETLPNDGNLDTEFVVTELQTVNSGDITDEVNDQGADNTTVDLEGEVQVPFEAEGTMGLVAIGGFLGYRYLKKRKQGLNQ